MHTLKNYLYERAHVFFISFSIVFLLYSLFSICINRFNVQIIKIIDTESRLRESEIHPFLKSSNYNFFRFNINALRDYIENIIPDTKIYVYRNWPYTIVVDISNSHVWANWNNRYLVDEDNKLIFAKPSNRLPYLECPSEYKDLIFKRFKTFSLALKNSGLIITHIVLNKSYIWKIVLNNNILIDAGDDNPDIITSKLKEVSKIYSKLARDVESLGFNIIRIDFRYKDGFSIGFSDSNPT